MSDAVVDRNTVVVNVAAAFIVGALLGAGAALLFAPQSGRKTRRDIRQFAETAGNKAGAVQIELRHSIENIIEDAEEKLREGLARGMDWTDSKIVDLQGALEAARKSIAAEIEKIQST
jgi:gas vesicle protein